MHKFVSFNQQIVPASATNISAISSAALHGKSVFTTVAIYDSQPFLWEKHWSRLVDNAARIGLDFEFSPKTVKILVNEIIARNKVQDGRARITFLDESAKGLWVVENQKSTSILITTADLRPPSNDLNLTVSPYRVNSTSALTNIKSGNYLENLLAIENARKKGFQEAIRLNEKGEIVSGCLANIFWVKTDKIFTPSLKTGCLAGTTRAYILEKIKVYEVEESLEILQTADGIFLTSAGIGIVPVKELQGKLFSKAIPAGIQSLSRQEK